MDKLERLTTLHAILDRARRPLRFREITERLECSPATAKRAIRELRTTLGAPLAFDPAYGGYRYVQPDGSPRYELPGLWFGADELAAIVTLREVLERLEPGLFGEVLAPLARRLEEFLARKHLGLREVSRRIRVLSQHARPPGTAFPIVARAVLSRRVLTFEYEGRERGAISRRNVSPQRLTRYRGCWYLDAWCHDQEALRTFALERITEARIGGAKARNIAEEELDVHYADAYGIFAGPATEVAVLRVSPRAARWVADEAWHPRQSGEFLSDGQYELRVPYGRPEELIADILRLGPEAEVVGPAVLREEVAKRIAKSVEIYRGRVRN